MSAAPASATGTPGTSPASQAAGGAGPGEAGVGEAGLGEEGRGEAGPVLSHFDAQGQAHMVDVGDKAHTLRQAVAEGAVVMTPATLALVMQGNAKKGDVLGVARLAGIMGAKKTADLIPLCHPLALTKVALDLVPDQALPGVRVVATVRTSGQTGVEMEALTAVSVACLTIYDMLKAAEKGMRIEGIRLLHKEGGKSGTYRANP